MELGLGGAGLELRRRFASRRFFVQDSLTLNDGIRGTDVASDITAFCAPENLQVWADGEHLVGVTPQGGPTSWRLDIRGGVWTSGDHVVELRVSHPEAGCMPGPCPLLRSVHFTTPSSDQLLEVAETYFYPNPVEASQGQYLYRLTRAGKSAQVTIYTVTGRRVRVLQEDAPLRPGLNAITWDLRDETGDQVSNGVYLLVLRVEGEDGQVVSPSYTPERVAVTR
jgi:hypothetical protein